MAHARVTVFEVVAFELSTKKLETINIYEQRTLAEVLDDLRQIFCSQPGWIYPIIAHYSDGTKKAPCFVDEMGGIWKGTERIGQL